MKDDNEGQKNLQDLIFVVNGVSTTVEKVNINQPLSVSVEKALRQTGNTGRDISEWVAKYNDVNLNTAEKVESLKLPQGATVFLSLKAGVGG